MAAQKSSHVGNTARPLCPLLTLVGPYPPPNFLSDVPPPPPADHNPIGDEGVELLGDGLKWARAASPWPVPISLPLPLCRGWHRWGASLFVQQALIQPFELPWLS